MGKPFFEPSFFGFFDPKRSASISSMSCAETDRGQTIGLWTQGHRAEPCPESSLLSVPPSYSSVCRWDPLQTHQSPWVEWKTLVTTLKFSHQNAAAPPLCPSTSDSPPSLFTSSASRLKMLLEADVLGEQRAKFRIWNHECRKALKKKISLSYRLRPPTSCAFPLAGCSDVRGLQSLKWQHLHSHHLFL